MRTLIACRRVLAALVGLAFAACRPALAQTATPPSPAPLPVAWVTYHGQRSTEEDFADLKAHGVGLVSMRASSVQDARSKLALARRTGMQYHIDVAEITERIDTVRSSGLTPVEALMIGGCYRGKAIDRHLFSFSAGKHQIVIEPPVYNQQYGYTRGEGERAESLGHYFPDMGAPVKAEVVVPLRRFDGQQHLVIRPAEVTPAPADAQLEADSVSPELPRSPEVAKRTLYRVAFDLTGLDDALLDQVGLAVYWTYRGSGRYFIFGRGDVSAWAESTREALRVQTRRTLDLWAQANDGTFPTDVVPAMRFGDECFYVTGHLNGPSVSFPLWDYSAPAIDAFRAHAGNTEYPRTWGYPEIYGEDAYAWWQYTLHEGTANLCETVREEIRGRAPGLRLFRNTTRMNVFDLINDHDGSGQDLLAQHLDIIHLDPYPVMAAGYQPVLVRDVSYCAGLARRYHKPLVPWMQAHVYGGPNGLRHVTPEDVDRMAGEAWAQGVDAVVWLGYGRGETFPATNPASWERAGAFHQRLQAGLPPKPQPKVAVLRSYRAWALSSVVEGNLVRNPADWLLQQWLEVLAVQHGQPYDVWEVPPVLDDAARARLTSELAKYPCVVSTMPWPGAWVLGEGTAGTIRNRADAAQVQAEFEAEMRARGVL